jgi:hypothetical protein
MCLRMQKGVGSLIWFASPAFGRRDPFGITVATQSPLLRLTAAGDNAAMDPIRLFAAFMLLMGPGLGQDRGRRSGRDDG